MDSLCIVMPAYNEEENITEAVEMWYSKLDGKSDSSRLVVADSGSADKTHSILLELQKTHPRLEILSDTEKQHGPKLIALYGYAVEKGFDYVFQTDSDGQTDSAEFEGFWDIRKRFDGVFGKRTNREDGCFRAFAERVLCIILKIFFGVKLPDANAPFRLMRTDILKKYLYKMHSNYNLPNVMITVYFAHYKEKMTFKTVSFKTRQGGAGSLNIPKIIKTGIRAVGDFKDFKRKMD